MIDFNTLEHLEYAWYEFYNLISKKFVISILNLRNRNRDEKKMLFVIDEEKDERRVLLLSDDDRFARSCVQTSWSWRILFWE